MSNDRSKTNNLMNVGRSDKVEKNKVGIVDRFMTSPHYFNDYQVLIC
jgi:hypothetical protein